MSEEWSPKIIGFLCNWCSYAGADLAGVSRMQYPPEIRIVRVMCSTRIDPFMVMELFRKGADGVMVAGCHPGDCHYITGNYFTERKIDLVWKLLEKMGINPERLKLVWISASEGEKFSREVREFRDLIQELGPISELPEEKLNIELAAARDAVMDFRLRALVAKELLLEKENVYGEAVPKERIEEVLNKAIEDDYHRHLILQHLRKQPLSVEELAEKTHLPASKVLDNIVVLRARNQVAMEDIRGNVPVYSAGGD